MKRERIVSRDGTELELYCWDEVKNPRGTVQLIHGMNEHLGRYDVLARYLNSLGLIVAGADHRAHGLTAGDPLRIGVAFGRDLFEDTVDDETLITGELARRYSLPIAIVSHSYGSFLAESYLLHRPMAKQIKAFVFAGSAKLPEIAIRAGELFALGNASSPAHMIERATFRAYDRRFREGRNAWLSKDTEIVEAYNADLWVNETFSKGFYRSFFRGMRNIYRDPDTDAVCDLPVLIMSGAEDGLGGYGKNAKRLHRWLCKIGFKNCDLTIYPSDRHELFNETDRTKVFADLGQFLARCFE